MNTSAIASGRLGPDIWGVTMRLSSSPNGWSAGSGSSSNTVQNSARNLTLFESLQESTVLYQRATGDVDQISALFHHRKLLFA